jgi:hypothetical protein
VIVRAQADGRRLLPTAATPDVRPLSPLADNPLKKQHKPHFPDLTKD